MSKIRTQVQLEEEEYEWLKKEAYKKRMSISSVLRETIDHAANIKIKRSGVNISKAMGFVGKGYCGKKDVSIHHDDYLSGTKK